MSSDKFSFWLSLSRFYPGNCRLCGHVDWNRCRTSIGYYSIDVVLETKAENQKTLAFRFVFSCLHQKSKLWYGMVWYGMVWLGYVMLLLSKEDIVVMTLVRHLIGRQLIIKDRFLAPDQFISRNVILQMLLKITTSPPPTPPHPAHEIEQSPGKTVYVLIVSITKCSNLIGYYKHLVIRQAKSDS